MRIKIINGFILGLMILSACTTGVVGPTTQPTAGATRTLPTAAVTVVGVPDPQVTARAFLADWQEDKYTDMYSMLTGVGKDAITQDNFVKRYFDVAVGLTLQSVEFEILTAITNPRSAQVAYRVTFKTALMGDITRENMLMNLSLEKDAWKVQWDDGLIMPELKGGNRLQLDYKVPARGDIYDRNGNIIAAAADAVAIGLNTGELDPNQEGTLLNQLSDLTGKTPQAIKALYENAGKGWYIAVGEAPAQDVNDRMNVLSNLGGLILNPFKSRYYYDGGIGPHVVGYVQPIFAEELLKYQRMGYSGAEKVGQTGIEYWAENQLSGQRGATLYVMSPSNQIVTRLGQTEAQPAQNVYTTLDKSLQEQAQKAIEGFRGSIVVLERDTGRVLAMVSSPEFDPNLFEPTNYNSGKQLGPLLNDAQKPLLDRAAEGTYPLGSVFKIITMSAALESGLYTADTTYNCGSYFTELEGVKLKDWTVDHEQPPSGLLTLKQGLMRSCNPYFYHLGLDLYRQKGDKIVSDMARGFGLGKDTGIAEIAEDAGNIPDPVNELDAVQMAIGQGAILVTPLQVATFIAAIGNGGTLYRPQVVEKVVSPDGVPSFSFSAVVNRKLPISQETLKTVQGAMYDVIENKRGTAYYAFLGMSIPIYGKTGTAENPLGDSHAWFAGYTDAKRTDKPDIAIAVIAENAGEGSEVAAPIFRRIVEDYFTGRPSTLYPWESSFYVEKTPPPDATATPQP